ncbi:peptidase inhibitor family I36 protein [Micromonospora sp. WMMD734]|uniref:peptidase inhibitor family I36 protein n=1 Tax=Micromonospora sp. WMMD734 TaxID=3404129 RepID=UPI003B938EB7
MNIKRGMIALVAIATAGVAALSLGAPAQATGKNGVLESGEFGLYYSPNQQGPVFDLYVSDSNFADDSFPGTGIPVNDNTASYHNRDTFYWWVYTAANYGGNSGCLSPGYRGNASTEFRNKISSARYLPYSC